MDEAPDPNVELQLENGYRFHVDFGRAGVPTLLMDESEPIGEGSGPSASETLAAAVGNCLSSSALFCLRKARITVHDMRTTVATSVTRNDAGRLRVTGLQVRIEPVVDEPDAGRVHRCLEIFEDYCVVTQSVRAGIDVDVEVVPRSPTG